MSVRKEYYEETGKFYYTEAMEFEWSTDYVEWLEKKAEKRDICPECWSHNVERTFHCTNCGLDYKKQIK